MAHEVEQMFYFGEVPWHGLGTELKEIPTSENAIIAAGLNWNVEKHNILCENGELPETRIEDFFAIKRDDKIGPKSVLGIVGKRYKPVQNKNAFNFFDTVVGEKKAIYHTAGSLCDGKVIWILAKLPEGISISSNDNVELYTLLMNRHDGKRSLIVRPTPIRVVCNNTLNMALSEKNTNSLSFRHTTNIDIQMKMAALSFNHSLKTFEETKAAYKVIAQKDVSRDSLEEYFNNVIDFNKKSKRSLIKRNKLVEVFDYDVQTNNLKPSLWVAYNSVTYMVDHEFGRDNKRLEKAWIGNGFDLKQKALNVALQMAA
jgi:phage/plasmid-like protein (TIGR03299 family)